MFNFRNFLLVPLCVFLANKGVIEWNDWASCSVVPALGAILLHEVLTIAAAEGLMWASLFVNAIIFTYLQA